LKESLSLSGSSDDDVKNKLSELIMSIQSKDSKIRALEAQVQKYNAGLDSLISEKIQEKQKVISELLTEHDKLQKKINELQMTSERNLVRLEKYRKFALDARETAEKTYNENKRLRAQIRSISKDSQEADEILSGIQEVKVSEHVKEIENMNGESFDAPSIAVDEKKYQDFMEQASKAEKQGKFDDTLWLYLQASSTNPK